MTRAVAAYIALGSNLGDRRKTLELALRDIGRLSDTRIAAASSFHETVPVGPQDQGLFLNAATVVETTLPPRSLLERLVEIERAHGRDRAAAAQRWGPRTLDLDLLLYGDAIIDEPGLHVPHPHLHERSFVLSPLAEVAPNAVHPILGLTIRELLAAMPVNAA